MAESKGRQSVTELSLVFIMWIWISHSQPLWHMGSQEGERGHAELPLKAPKAALGCAASRSQGVAVWLHGGSLPWERGCWTIQETQPRARALGVCGTGEVTWGEGRLLCSWGSSWSIRSKMCHRIRVHTAARRWQNPALSASFMSQRDFWWSPAFSILTWRTLSQMDVGAIKKIYNGESALICNNQTWTQNSNK